MTISGIDKETGEFGGDEIYVKCNPLINKETGEWEYAVAKPFKIPSTKLIVKKPLKLVVKQSCRNDHKYTIILMIFTLIMFLPKIGISIWVLIETMSHLYLHRRPHLMAKCKLQGYLSEFCSYCQAERCKNIVGKLQDVRTNKMRQYVRNIPIGT